MMVVAREDSRFRARVMTRNASSHERVALCTPYHRRIHVSYIDDQSEPRLPFI